MNIGTERPQVTDPHALVGTFWRFRSGGPPYEVLAVNAERGTGTIRILESGEEIDYPIVKIVADEEA